MLILLFVDLNIVFVDFTTTVDYDSNVVGSDFDIPFHKKKIWF